MTCPEGKRAAEMLMMGEHVEQVKGKFLSCTEARQIHDLEYFHVL